MTPTETPRGRVRGVKTEQWAAGSAPSVSRSHGLPRVGGVVVLDLRIEPDGHRVARLVQSAAYAPAGAHVVLQVARGQNVPGWAVEWLREHGRHLGQVDVHGDSPEAVRRLVCALRGAE